MRSLHTSLLRCVFIFTLIFHLSGIQSQVLGIYEFSGTGVCPQNNTTVTHQPADAFFSNFMSVNTTCTASNDVFNNKSWNTSSNIDLSEYNEFRVIADNCFRLNLTSLHFEHKLSTGTANWYVRSNLDNFAADLSSGTSTSTQATELINLPSQFTEVDTLIVRFYITGISSGTTTWRQDNVKLAGTVNSISPVSYYIDNDGDGYGTGTGVLMCSNPGGYALNDADCNDNNATVHPNAVWYADVDSDGYGDPLTAETGCSSSLTNATLIGNDCDDDNESVHPLTVWYEDADVDGFGDEQTTETGCSSIFENPVLVGGDCNDSEAAVYPGAPEICDAFDNDCNNLVNDGLPMTNYYVDADNDGFGVGNAVSFCENPGAAYALQNGDCDDGAADIHPGAAEIQGNGIDENCDGTDGYLSLKELDLTQFAVFPNPGNDFVILKTNGFGQNPIVRFYTVSGLLVKSLALISSGENKIDTQHLEKGIYMIELRSDERKNVLRWVKN